VILPAIDPHSPKNRSIDDASAHAILAQVGLEPAAGHADLLGPEVGRPPGWATRLAQVEQDEPLPPDAPTVLQISRWDALKDMAGVLTGFVNRVASHSRIHLVLAGPDPRAIADDPGGVEVLAQISARRAALPDGIRRRIHLVTTAGDDLEGTAFVINLLQRRAGVVTQKSIREGFGLTVTEAMWKAKAVVGTRVGAMPAQILHRTTGMLITDPTDLDSFGDAVAELMTDAELRNRLGRRGQAHCAERFLLDHQLVKYATLFADLAEHHRKLTHPE
jgi:trehalose synthase